MMMSGTALRAGLALAGPLLAGLLATTPARAESGLDVAARVAQTCIARIAGGQFPDPVRREELQPTTAANTANYATYHDSAFRVASSDGAVFLVANDSRCASDTFDLGAAALSQRIGPMLTAAPYNARFMDLSKPPGAAGALHIWIIHTAKGDIDVVIGEDGGGRRVIVLVNKE
jgi:hypothetical protein